LLLADPTSMEFCQVSKRIHDSEFWRSNPLKIKEESSSHSNLCWWNSSDESQGEIDLHFSYSTVVGVGAGAFSIWLHGYRADFTRPLSHVSWTLRRAVSVRCQKWHTPSLCGRTGSSDVCGCIIADRGIRSRQLFNKSDRPNIAYLCFPSPKQFNFTHVSGFVLQGHSKRNLHFQKFILQVLLNVSLTRKKSDATQNYSFSGEAI
jgi:hypothetical protein